MLESKDYESVKESFLESERLFNKLIDTSNKFINMEYDESGFYQDELDTYQRHCSKLSSKILENISKELDGFEIKIVENDILEKKELEIKFLKDQTESVICVDFKQIDQLKIIQIS